MHTKKYLQNIGLCKKSIIDRYRGRVKGIKFRSEFLGWIEGSLKSDEMVQRGLF